MRNFYVLFSSNLAKILGGVSLVILCLILTSSVKVVHANPDIFVDLKLDGQDGSAPPISVTAGQSATLSWNVTSTSGFNNFHCTASGSWTGAKNFPSGSENVTVTNDGVNTYRLACEITDGATGLPVEGASDEVHVTIVAAATDVTLYANDQRPTLTISGSGDVTLRWTTSNSPFFCQGSWAPGDLLNTNGGTATVNVTSTTTYTITCQRQGSPDSTSSVTVQIGLAPPPPPPPGTVSGVQLCSSFGDIVAIVQFPYSPVPPAITNLMQVRSGDRYGPIIATIDPWPANIVKIAGIFSPGVTYFFQGYLVLSSGTAIHDDPPAVVIADTASMPPCVGGPPASPPPSPTPAPSVVTDCSSPKQTDQFTKVSIAPLPDHVVTISGPDTTTDWVPIGATPPPIHLTNAINSKLHFLINEDFSKITSIFADPNSNYLESEVQTQAHRDQDIMNLNSQDFNEFNKAGQKAAPLYLTDDLRMDYVGKVNADPKLNEAPNTFSDYNGANPKTVAQMVTDYGAPNPPSHGGDQETWNTTWGMYWTKIPTAVNENYLAWVSYGITYGNPQWEHLIDPDPNNQLRWCPAQYNTKFFLMKDYFRSASVMNELNQIIVPKAAQSSYADFSKNPPGLISTLEHAKDFIAKIKDQGIIAAVKKLFKISLNTFEIIKNVYAQESDISGPDNKCPIPIPVLPNQNVGSGPFCRFQSQFTSPNGTVINQLGPGESCDADGVKCTFVLDAFPAAGTNFNVPQHTASIPQDPDWDAPCVEEKRGDDGFGNPTEHRFVCTMTVRLYRTYYLPWLASSWNNSMYSDEADRIAITGQGLTGFEGQKTGRPGIFGFFTPKSVESTVHPKGKNLPSEETGSADGVGVKERFFGAVNCAKNWARDIALKPISLQGFLGILPSCPAS